MSMVIQQCIYKLTYHPMLRRLSFLSWNFVYLHIKLCIWLRMLFSNQTSLTKKFKVSWAFTKPLRLFKSRGGRLRFLKDVPRSPGIAINKEWSFKFFKLEYLVHYQIWLNLIVDDCHILYITLQCTWRIPNHVLSPCYAYFGHVMGIRGMSHVTGT